MGARRAHRRRRVFQESRQQNGPRQRHPFGTAAFAHHSLLSSHPGPTAHLEIQGKTRRRKTLQSSALGRRGATTRRAASGTTASSGDARGGSLRRPRARRDSISNSHGIERRGRASRIAHRASRIANRASRIAHRASLQAWRLLTGSVDAVWAAVDTLIDQAPSPQVFQAAPDEAWLTANADPIQLLEVSRSQGGIAPIRSTGWLPQVHPRGRGLPAQGRGTGFLRESLSWVCKQLMEAEVSELVGGRPRRAGSRRATYLPIGTATGCGRG